MANNSKRIAKGYTLVELLVAALLLGIVVVSVVALVRKGRELDTADRHRRQVRTIIEQVMETQFDYRNFNTFIVGNTNVMVTLETVNGNPFQANMNTQVQIQNQNIAGVFSPVATVTVAVNWNETNGENHAIVINKQIPDLDFN